MSDNKPLVFDGVWALTTIHRIAAELGYERTRQDRGTDPRTNRYYEVGYGPMFTVVLLTSLGEVFRTTKETWDAFTEEKVHDVLQSNLVRVA